MYADRPHVYSERAPPADINQGTHSMPVSLQKRRGSTSAIVEPKEQEATLSCKWKSTQLMGRTKKATDRN